MEKEKKQQKQYADGSEAQLPELTEPADARDGFVPFSELPLSDGFLFGEVMQDEETCRTVLEIILKRPVSRVVYVNKEQQMYTLRMMRVLVTMWRCRPGTGIAFRREAAITRG